jgi:ADP-heptose:LPS heptosyltransferase
VNVLAIQLRRAGDILMTTPALRALKERFAHAEVTFLCDRHCSPILRASPHVDTVLRHEPEGGPQETLRLLASLRERTFDLVLDFEASTYSAVLTAGSGARRRVGFRGSLRGWAYTDRVPQPRPGGYLADEKLALLAPLGVDVGRANRRPTVSVDPRARDWARRTIEAADVASGDFLLVVTPGARGAAYRWPLERFAQFLDAFATTHEIETIVIPSPDAESLGRDLARATAVPLLQLSAAPSLAQIAAVLDRADLHVGNENAARHVACALGTASVAVFPPGQRRRWSLAGDPLQAGVEPSAAAAALAEAGADGAAAAPPLATVTAEEVHAQVLALEPYLPRLRAARRAVRASGLARRPETAGAQLEADLSRGSPAS